MTDSTHDLLYRDEDGQFSDIQELAAFGLGLTRDLRNVRPKRLSTIHERQLISRAFKRASALSDDEFIVSAWGFPPMPIPVKSEAAVKSVNAADLSRSPHRVPRHVNFDMAGHPVFWIDEKLTAPTEDERDHPERWAVRMFYLINAFGLWDSSNLRWIDAVRVFNNQGMRYTKDDLENYIAGYSSPMDDIKWNERHMEIPLTEVQRATNTAIAECVELERAEWMLFEHSRRQAKEDAERFLGYDEHGEKVYDDADDEIQTFTDYPQILASIKENSTEFYRSVYDSEMGNHSISDSDTTTKNLRALSESISAASDRLAKAEKIIAILTAPVTRSLSAGTPIYQQIMTIVELYRQRVSMGGYENDLKSLYEDMSSASAITSEESFTELYRRSFEMFNDVVRRMRFAYANSRRYDLNRAPYESLEQFEAELGLFGASNSITVPTSDKSDDSFTGLMDTDSE